MQNIDNLIKVTSIIISTWTNKRLFSGVLVNGKLDVGQDNRSYTIVRNQIDAALSEKSMRLTRSIILQYLITTRLKTTIQRKKKQLQFLDQKLTQRAVRKYMHTLETIRQRTQVAQQQPQLVALALPEKKLLSMNLRI